MGDYTQRFLTNNEDCVKDELKQIIYRLSILYSDRKTRETVAFNDFLLYLSRHIKNTIKSEIEDCSMDYDVKSELFAIEYIGVDKIVNKSIQHIDIVYDWMQGD